MRHSIIFFVLVFMLLSTTTASAGTYQFTDKNGTTWLTNKKLTQNRSAQYTSLNRSLKSTSTVSCISPNDKAQRHKMAHYNALINSYAKRYRVNTQLIHAIVSTESCYDANAVSSVGAQGLMQLMPSTAKGLGVTDAFDVRQNLKAGIELFSQLNKQFNYNHHYALAAYNAGPSAVEKYAGIPPYKETRNYVKKVLAKYKELIKTNTMQ
jgi:soluble lytic murein transglycosylase-like protein